MTGSLAGERLLVLVPDAVSDLIAKGEVVERYYNPGDLFGEVHLVLTNDDRPDPSAVQPMIGTAALHIHNLPTPSFRRTFGWQPPLIRDWTRAGLDLAGEIRPALVRTINNFIEGYLASEIKRAYGTPYVVSLHGVWDRDCLVSWEDRLLHRFRKKFEQRALRDADAVIAVYEPIIRYAQELGAGRVELIYNVLADGHLEPKAGYELARPVRLITVNRQRLEKNPENIIRAVSELDCEYLVVGDGPYHERLEALAHDLGCADRVRFVRAIPNAELSASYKDFDLMVSHCDYWGVSKTLLEGALVGLPIVVNHHPLVPILDYEGGWVRLCENTVEGYRRAITELVENRAEREALGRRAGEHARRFFAPSEMEQRTTELYRSVIRAPAAAAPPP